MKQLKSLLLIILALLLCGACNMQRFETAEEIRRREDEQRQMREKTRLEAHADMLAGEQNIQRELKNEDGQVLARYEAVVPTFSSEGYQEVACQRMNDYFEAEFTEYAADCDAFFESVKRQYGDEWGTASPQGLYTTTFSYELLETPLRYLCIRRTYIYTQPDGTGYTLFYPDIFLAENGWRLEFNDLFGLNADAADEKAMVLISQWCEDNEIPSERLPGLTIEDFWSSVAMTKEHLIFYVQPFTLSTNDKNSYEIALDIKLFQALLTEPIDE